MGRGKYELWNWHLLCINCRSELCKFRVNGEGFQNRYRNRDNLFPHVDQAYACIYSGKDNSDYTNDENRNNRRMNLKIDKYNVGQQVNGIFHMQVIEATPEWLKNKTVLLLKTCTWCCGVFVSHFKNKRLILFAVIEWWHLWVFSKSWFPELFAGIRLKMF